MTDCTNLNDFRAHYEEMTPHKAVDAMSDLMFEDVAGTVLAFCGYAWAVKNPDGTYWAIIERDEYTGDFDHVSAAVFFEHYVSETVSAGEWTTNSLSDLLRDYSAWRGLTYASADEMLVEALRHHPNQRTTTEIRVCQWLEWFIGVWDVVQEREDRTA